jgi:hypothetical protein
MLFQLISMGVPIGLVLGIGWAIYSWQANEIQRMIANWAAANRYEIVERRNETPFGAGPLNRYGGNKQVTYRVVVKDEVGALRRGTLRVGSSAAGPLSQDIEVEWD